MSIPPSHWAEIKTLFDALAELNPAQRDPLIAKAALEEAPLAELRSLLAHHDQAQSFLSMPATGPLEDEAPRTGLRMGAWEIVRAVGVGGMGEVFESVRLAATSGASTATAWAEWGADPELMADPKVSKALSATIREWTPEVEAVTWSANPAWNSRINLEVVQGEFESYTPEEYALDRLGVWLADIGQGTRDISAEAWSATEGLPAVDGVPSYGVAFSPDGLRMALGGGFKAEDETVHVELVDDVFEGAVDGGFRPLVDWFLEKNDAGVARWRRAGLAAR